MTFAELGSAQKVQMQASPVVLRCPHCCAVGTFPAENPGSGFQFQVALDARTYAINLGFSARLCPNLGCMKPVFIAESNGNIAYSAPPQSIDFDALNVPSKVAESVREAILCHSVGCFRASALMIRRSLEEICEDKGANGDNLKVRIESLSKTIVVPKALIDALDQLRVLGNDAAHIEARIYDEIGSPEVEIGLILCKEFIKATYQLDDLVNRLRKLGGP